MLRCTSSALTNSESTWGLGYGHPIFNCIRRIQHNGRNSSRYKTKRTTHSVVGLTRLTCVEYGPQSLFVRLGCHIYAECSSGSPTILELESTRCSQARSLWRCRGAHAGTAISLTAQHRVHHGHAVCTLIQIHVQKHHVHVQLSCSVVV